MRTVIGLTSFCLTILAAHYALGSGAGDRGAAVDRDPARRRSSPHACAARRRILTLPGADVCLKGQACTKGDSSIEADFLAALPRQPAFCDRRGRDAGDQTNHRQPADRGRNRSLHTRSYFLVEGQGRYYALHTETLEAWIGATVGGVIVSDRYAIEGGEVPTAAIIGPRASTLRTEGGTIGGLIGAQWSFAPNWAVGLNARYMRWFLPSEPATTVFFLIAPR